MEESGMSEASLGAIGQVSRTVRDIDASTAWYRDVLGFRPLYQFGQLSFFDCDGVRLYLQQSDAPGVESVLYFRVSDIGAAYERLVAKGVTFIQTPQRIHTHADGTEEWMAFFQDLEGRPLALMAVV
jgi:catechol 2,3-dioxygenase-like lactoylglutathione lyase family enzyme